MTTALRIATTVGAAGIVAKLVWTAAHARTAGEAALPAVIGLTLAVAVTWRCVRWMRGERA